MAIVDAMALRGSIFNVRLWPARAQKDRFRRSALSCCATTLSKELVCLAVILKQRHQTKKAWLSEVAKSPAVNYNWDRSWEYYPLTKGLGLLPARRNDFVSDQRERKDSECLNKPSGYARKEITRMGLSLG